MNLKPSIPNPQGINVYIKPKNHIYWRDPKYTIQNHDQNLEQSPITKDSSLTNGSVLNDRFNIVPLKLTPINAMFLDPKTSIYIIPTNITPKMNTDIISFLNTDNQKHQNEDNTIISEKPDMKIYLKLIMYIQNRMANHLNHAEKIIMKKSLDSLQKSYIQNKNSLTNKILTNILDKYYSDVKEVYEDYYKRSDQSFNPMHEFEMGIISEDLSLIV